MYLYSVLNSYCFTILHNSCLYKFQKSTTIGCECTRIGFSCMAENLKKVMRLLRYPPFQPWEAKWSLLCFSVLHCACLRGCVLDLCTMYHLVTVHGTNVSMTTSSPTQLETMMIFVCTVCTEENQRWVKYFIKPFLPR
jgi:hypothetical protein